MDHCFRRGGNRSTDRRSLHEQARPATRQDHPARPQRPPAQHERGAVHQQLPALRMVRGGIRRHLRLVPGGQRSPDRLLQSPLSRTEAALRATPQPHEQPARRACPAIGTGLREVERRERERPSAVFVQKCTFTASALFHFLKLLSLNSIITLFMSLRQPNQRNNCRRENNGRSY